MELAAPVFNPMFYSLADKLRKCLCLNCTRLLAIPDMDRPPPTDCVVEERGDDSKTPRLYPSLLVTHLSPIDAIVEATKKATDCVHCGFSSRLIKAVPFATGIHGWKFRHNDRAPKTALRDKESVALAANLANRKLLGAEEWREMMDHLDVIDLYHLGVSSRAYDTPDPRWRQRMSHPSNFVMQCMPIMPSVCRPTVVMAKGTRFDALTDSFEHLVKTNLAAAPAMRTAHHLAVEHRVKLQNAVNAIFSSKFSTKAYSRTIAAADVALGADEQISDTGGGGRGRYATDCGIIARLKGKGGRFRRHLSGKHTQFCARTVAGPDPNLAIDEVGVPYSICAALTYPVTVCHENLKVMRAAVLRGPAKPWADPRGEWVEPSWRKYEAGAVMVEYPTGEDGCTRPSMIVNAKNHKILAADLVVGCRVRMQLGKGKVILVNRQPSLYDPSFIACKVVPMSGSTIRLNLANCYGLNLDFDGDDLNLHVPQNDMAAAEASELMMSSKHAVDSSTGASIKGLSQDGLTGAAVLSQKGQFIGREDMMQLAMIIGKYDLPIPAILKPVPLWTGKQAMSMTFDEDWCYTTGTNDFLIRNGQLVNGTAHKSTLGQNSATGLMQHIAKSKGCERATQLSFDLSRLSDYCLMSMSGFTIGIEDMLIRDRGGCPVSDIKSADAEEWRVERDRLEKALDRTSEFKRAVMERRAPDDHERLECVTLMATTKKHHQVITEMISRGTRRNNLAFMVACASKGNSGNIGQISGCLGLQQVDGQRIEMLYKSHGTSRFGTRAHPHDRYGQWQFDARCRGYVFGSFLHGLDPREMFDHARGGRSAETAKTKVTPKAGYLERRLAKALEDLILTHDRTVRDAENNVIAFSYGDDGQNVAASTDVIATVPPLAAIHYSLPLITPTTEMDSKYICERMAASLRSLSAWAVNPKLGIVRGSSTLNIDQNIATVMCGVGMSAENRVAATSVSSHVAKLLRELPLLSSFSVIEIVTRLSPLVFPPPLAPECHDTQRQRDDSILRWNRAFVSEYSFKELIDKIATSWHRGQMEPGTSIGMRVALNISQVGTQMTLRAFHFAGSKTAVMDALPDLEVLLASSCPMVTPQFSNYTAAGWCIKKRNEFHSKLVDRPRRWAVPHYRRISRHMATGDMNEAYYMPGQSQKLKYVTTVFPKPNTAQAAAILAEKVLKPICLEWVLTPQIEWLSAAAVDNDIKWIIAASSGDDEEEDDDADEKKMAKRKGPFGDNPEARKLKRGQHRPRMPPNSGYALVLRADTAAIRKLGTTLREIEESMSSIYLEPECYCGHRKTKLDGDNGIRVEYIIMYCVPYDADQETIFKRCDKKTGNPTEAFTTGPPNYAFDDNNEGSACDWDSTFRRCLLSIWWTKFASRYVRGSPYWVTANAATTNGGSDHCVMLEGGSLLTLFTIPSKIVSRAGKIVSVATDTTWTLEIDHDRTVSTHIAQFAVTYGIEAAHAMIKSHAMAIVDGSSDVRNPALIADAMTSSGNVRSFHRSGIVKRKNNPLMRASNEEVEGVLRESTMRSELDSLHTPSARVIMGQAIQSGTGTMFELQLNITGLRKLYDDGGDDHDVRVFDEVDMDAIFDSGSDDDDDEGETKRREFSPVRGGRSPCYSPTSPSYAPPSPLPYVPSYDPDRMAPATPTAAENKSTSYVPSSPSYSPPDTPGYTPMWVPPSHWPLFTNGLATLSHIDQSIRSS